jgi:broad specificity phosphatase PhoE
MPNMLTSWKEIGQYLGKGVRTVQRWERESGLPVRRAVHPSRRAVLALPEELDEWARSRTRGPIGPLGESLRKSQTALREEIEELRKRLEFVEVAVFAHRGPTRKATGSARRRRVPGATVTPLRAKDVRV